MSEDKIWPAGCETAASPPDGPSINEVRRRLIRKIEGIDSVDDLEFLELMATLPDMPFSEAAAVTGAAAREARPAVGLRAMYRRVVAPEICDALERSTRQLAQPARLDADGLREDLGVVVQTLYMLLGYDPSGLEQLLVVAPAARAVAALAPAVEDARSSRHSLDNETQGFRYGQMGGLTAEQRQLLYWASRGSYEAMLEDDPAPPPVTDELAACADELDWLVPALAELGDEALAGTVDGVARDLRTSLAAIPDLVAAVERFAVHRKAAPPDSDDPSSTNPDNLDSERTE